ncbi:hypothetical protein AGMMS49991_08820 [Spirochaetia bacterium]|nr:hypothetical protein AGMMS49991_08820 [Spirochaetia bacterium]
MKKAAAIVVFGFLVSSAVFAELNWSAYGRGVFTPIAFSDGNSSVSAATTTYGNHGGQPRVGFTVAGVNASKTIGFTAMFNWDGAPYVGENANVWVQPFKFLKLTVGRFEVDDFRGRIGAAEFSSWILPDGTRDEDAVFMRFKADTGAHLKVEPLLWWDSPWNGLTIEAAVGSNIGGDRAFKNILDMSASDVYGAIHAGIGYRIPNIGFARVQFIGNNREAFWEDYQYANNDVKIRLASGLSTWQDADIIEAAFLYDGIKNLKIEAGIHIPLSYTTSLPDYVYYKGVLDQNAWYHTGNINGRDTLDVTKPMSAVLGATYLWNNFSFLARADLAWGGKYDHHGERVINIGMDLGLLAQVYYRFEGIYRVGLDIGYNHHSFDTEEDPAGNRLNIGEREKDIETSLRNDFGFAPWVAMDLGGGVIKVGVAVMIPSSQRWDYNDTYPGDGWKQLYSGKPVISIPISFTYSL